MSDRKETADNLSEEGVVGFTGLEPFYFYLAKNKIINIILKSLIHLSLAF